MLIIRLIYQRYEVLTLKCKSFIGFLILQAKNTSSLHQVFVKLILIINSICFNAIQ
jgi:hypothetical protein